MVSHDYLIVGGGVIGLSLAYELKSRQSSLKVAVVDQKKAGREATWASVGTLEPQLVFESSQFTNDSGLQKSFFNLCRASQLIFEEYLRPLEYHSHIDCEYRKEGVLRLLPDGASGTHLVNFFAGLGLRADYWTAEEAGDREPALEEGYAAIHLPDNHQVENRRLAGALIEACVRVGVELMENIPVIDFEVRSDHVAAALTRHSELRAGHYVICAGSWSSQFASLHTIVPAVKPMRGQIVALKMPRPGFVRFSAYLEDFYYVPRNDGRLLVGSTVEDAGFDGSVRKDINQLFLSRLQQIIPSSDTFEIVEEWVGFRPMAQDGYPLLGGTELKNLFVATGHFRNGILLMPITARLMADYLLNHETHILMKPFGVARCFRSGAA